MAATYSVPFLLSFDLPAPSGKAPGVKMGRGEAGWTVEFFPTREAAQAFADSIPLASRCRNHGVSGPKQ